MRKRKKIADLKFKANKTSRRKQNGIFMTWSRQIFLKPD